MSDTLRRLRLVFGDELFVRAAGAMQPTPKAKVLAEEIGPLLGRMRRVLDGHVTFLPGESNDTFTLASTDYTTLVLLPAAAGGDAPSGAAVDLRVTGYEKEAIGGMLDRGEVDLAFGVFPDPPDNLVRTRLFNERFVGIARSDHPRIGGSVIDLETFVALPHALVSVRRDERGAIDQVLARLGLRRRIALVVPYMLLLPKALALSDMIAIVPNARQERWSAQTYGRSNCLSKRQPGRSTCSGALPRGRSGDVLAAGPHRGSGESFCDHGRNAVMSRQTNRSLRRLLTSSNLGWQWRSDRQEK